MSKKTYGAGNHFKYAIKRLQKIKFNFVEQGVCARPFRITAFVVGSGKNFVNLATLTNEFPEYNLYFH
jgi:hypothetical protein